MIIRRNGEYLVGTVLYSRDLRWSIYRHDAYRMRNRDYAERLARKTGGVVMLWNPVVEQIRVL